MRILAIVFALASLSAESASIWAEASDLPTYSLQPVERQVDARDLTIENLNATNFLRRGFHGSTVVDNWLYIDGGYFSYFQDNLNGAIKVQALKTIVALDISKGWVKDTDQLHYVETPKPPLCPSLAYSTLWYDPTQKALLMGFAGEGSQIVGNFPTQMWKFALDGQGGGTWSDVTNKTDPVWDSLARPEYGMQAYSNESAYYFGGVSDYMTQPETASVSPNSTVPIPGMVEYNFQTATWTNHSAVGAYNNDGTGAYGEMVYAPTFGKKGIFVVLGGAYGGMRQYVQKNDLQGFDKITIWDPDTKTWHHQTATGNVPEPRLNFCAIGMAGSNKKTDVFDIFMYAGWNGLETGAESVRFDQVYVLSLPAFKWTIVNYPPTSPRYGHSCHSAGNRQWILVGGVDPSQADYTRRFESKDNVKQGYGVFDASALVWTPGLIANAGPYEQNKDIAAAYEDGNKFPAWNEPALAAIFGDTSKAAPSKPSAPSPLTSRPSLPTAVIVGAIVGGLTGLVLLLIGICLLWRLRHSSPPSYSEEKPPPTPAKDYPPPPSSRGSSLQKPDLALMRSPRELMDNDMHFRWPGEAPGNTNEPRDQYAPEKVRGLGLGYVIKERRYLELAHPQVAAAEMDAVVDRGVWGASPKQARPARPLSV